MTYRPEKAYKNLDFLNSPPARHLRILSEYEEPRQRFLHHGVRDTVVFFGSARAREPEEAARLVAETEAAAADRPDDADLQRALDRARGAAKLARYYEDARAFARELTRWSLYRGERERRYTICTGGGPGIMEAANRGASEVEQGRSVGLGISLPFEPGVNPYVTRELAFEFHYFFMRKYWFVYLMKACVIFPGGFGTMDELFETLTLLQTGKVRKQVPLVLFGKDYWDSVLDLDQMVHHGVISPPDLDLMKVCDDVDEAMAFLKAQLVAIEHANAR